MLDSLTIIVTCFSVFIFCFLVICCDSHTRRTLTNGKHNNNVAAYIVLLQ